MNKRALMSSITALGFGLLCPACLPDDTRAPPGDLLVTVSADPALAAGSVSSEDGWSLAIARFLLVLGDANLDGDDCDAYSDTGYDRIFELTRPSPQRVSLGYGLGSCRFGFRISPPSWNTVRGEGVTPSDELLLRTPGSDAQADDVGVSVHLEGSAARQGVTKTFSWSFRRFIDYNQCEPALLLSANERTEVDILVSALALFRNARREPEAPVRFEPFRAADDEHGDADGSITLAELHASPVPPDAIPVAAAANLGDRVYLQLLPEIAQLRSPSRCPVRSSPERPDFDGP